jgi:hypothetical protein
MTAVSDAHRGGGQRRTGAETEDTTSTQAGPVMRQSASAADADDVWEPSYADLDSEQSFRAFMANWPTGVTVLTTQVGVQPLGCTAQSLMSVSLEPPQLVVSLAETSHTLAGVRRSGVFGLSILHAGQAELGRRFAVGTAEERFQDTCEPRGWPACSSVRDCAVRPGARTLLARLAPRTTRRTCGGCASGRVTHDRSDTRRVKVWPLSDEYASPKSPPVGGVHSRTRSAGLSTMERTRGAPGRCSRSTSVTAVRVDQTVVRTTHLPYPRRRRRRPCRGPSRW